MMGIVPEPQAATVDDVLYVRSQLLPSVSSAQLGNKITLSLESFSAQGNMLDTAGYETRYGRRLYYALIPMAMGLFDESGTELKTVQFNHLQYLDANWYAGNSSLSMELPQDLGDGEYRIKLFYSLDNGEHYDNKVLDFSSKELYVKVLVHEGVAYLTDCFLSNSYGLESISASSGATVNQPFTVDAKLSYEAWGSQGGPLGNVYVSMLKDGQEVATSALCEVKLQNNTQQTYHIEITAPSEWGTYELVLKDESGNRMMKPNGWLGADDLSTSVFVLPVCDALIEDFESMTANSSTTQKNVPGNFTTWTFYKSGVRAPGEDLSNGANSVMMKKPSYVYSTEPVYHNFFMAQATFFNPTSSVSKYTLEYSVDGGTTWQKANTLNEVNVAEVPEKSKTLVTWMLNLTEAMPATFRITMMGGGTAATYVDDISFYYVDPICDVNGDGEISIADVNAVIDVIFSSGDLQLLAADVNKDGEININDINIIIDRMLSE